MEKIILIFLGGGAGALARYGVGVVAMKRLGAGWPYGTFTVNAVGGLLMGALIGFLAHRGGADQERWRVFLAVGVLGGFSTFSSFSLEVALMMERREYGQACLYVMLSVVLAVGALFVGLLSARRIFS